MVVGYEILAERRARFDAGSQRCCWTVGNLRLVVLKVVSRCQQATASR